MGNKAQANISKGIDAQMDECEADERNKITLVLLSTENSGQSTIFQQMQILKGMPPNNVTETIQSIRSQCKSLAINLCQMMHYLKSLQEVNKLSMDDEQQRMKLFKIVTNMWNNRQVQQRYKFRHIDPTYGYSYKIMDNAEYFIQKMDEIMSSDYKPTDEDIIKSHSKECGIQTFEWTEGRDRPVVYSLTDAPTKFLRKKAFLFGHVSALIFVVDLTKIAMKHSEDCNLNAMKDTMYQFEDVINRKWFRHTKVILIFNKYDKFRDIIASGGSISDSYANDYFRWSVEYGSMKHVVMASIFAKRIQRENGINIPEEIVELLQEYVSNPEKNEDELEECCQKVLKFLMDWFQKLSHDWNKHIFWHVMTAIDTENVQKIFWDIVISTDRYRGLKYGGLV